MIYVPDVNDVAGVHRWHDGCGWRGYHPETLVPGNSGTGGRQKRYGNRIHIKVSDPGRTVRPRTVRQPYDGAEEEGRLDMSVFTTVAPSYADVLEVRAGRVAMVRDYLAAVTPGELAGTRENPWEPEYRPTVLSCLHVILNEEWEHHRFAVRDLDAIEATSSA
jgi:DinB superfamily